MGAPGFAVRFRRLAPGLAAFVVAFAAYWIVFHTMHQPTVGDEAHYVLEAHSLAEDGDRDLRDDYADTPG